MSTPAKLELYLVKLDKALGPIAISEKADIVTEIRSHVLEAQRHDESQSIESILASLGEPEIVANRYLLERGLKPQKAPKHPIIKWLVIGFLGTMSIFIIFVLILIWQFSPLIKIDNEGGRIAILGGLIDVNEGTGSIKVGSLDIREDMKRSEDIGSVEIDLKNKPAIEIVFGNGKIDLENASGANLEWKCKGLGSSGFLVEEKNKTKLNLKNFGMVKCNIGIPAGVNLVLNGNNGEIELDKPHYHVSAKLLNGKINFIEDASLKYSYFTSVVTGKIDNFKSDSSKDAYKIEMSLINGKILKN